MTGLTYKSRDDEQRDKAQLVKLLTALNAWDRALRRDECSLWTIKGKHGCITTWGDGKTFTVWAERSKQAWGQLDFAEVTQSGDASDGAVLRLHEFPTIAQATTMRKVLGIRKRMAVTPETLERLLALSKSRQIVPELSKNQGEVLP